jgi:hypothetical protein
MPSYPPDRLKAPYCALCESTYRALREQNPTVLGDNSTLECYSRFPYVTQPTYLTNPTYQTCLTYLTYSTYRGRNVSFCTRQLASSPTSSSFSLRQSIALTMLNSFGIRPALPNWPTTLPSSSSL